jgi:mannosyltransferase OCH1-like enzyme
MECIYMWNMNPTETKVPNKLLMQENAKIFPIYKIVGPSDILPLVQQFSNELYDMWLTIPHWVIKADLGRLLYIYYNGGMYCDCDCLIRKTITSNAPIVLFTECIVNVNQLGPLECKHPDNKVRVANYAFIAKKGHPFLKNVITECIRRLHLLPSKLTHADILWVCGPDVITTVYHLQKTPDIELLNQSYLTHYRCGSWR